MDRIKAGNELAFRIGFSGHSGHLRLEPLPPVESSHPLKSLPDFILPPAFPPETQETLKQHLEDTYLCPALDSDEFSAEKAGRMWEFDWFDRAKVPLEPSVPRSIVAPVWELPFRRLKNHDHPEPWDLKSVQIDVAEIMEKAQDSSILPRMPGPAKDFVRGSINNRPFHPGGLENSQSERTLPEGALNGEWVREIFDGGIAQSVPPSFRKGLDLGYLKGFPCQQAKEQISSPDNLIEENHAINHSLRYHRDRREREREMSIIRRSNVFDPFSVNLWDPFEDFPFGSSLSFPRSGLSSETSAFAGARFDWRETPEAHVFKADLPGLKKEEVKVEVEEGRILQISGERKREEEEKSDTWHRIERSSGSFFRRFRLPENAKADQVRAAMENGVLTVTVPKEEVNKPELKSIEIAG